MDFDLSEIEMDPENLLSVMEPPSVPHILTFDSMWQLHSTGWILLLHEYDVFEHHSPEQLELARALFQVALHGEPAEDVVVGDEDFDYITCEELRKGMHCYVLDDCKNALLTASSLERLLHEQKNHKNPMTRNPIQSITKVMLI